MNISKFTKEKGNKFSAEGECSFCKNNFSGEVIISNNIVDRTKVTKRDKNVGSIFLWNTPGPNLKDIIDFLLGKDFMKNNYILKLFANIKKKDCDVRFGVGFPRLMFTCDKCFRKGN